MSMWDNKPRSLTTGQPDRADRRITCWSGTFQLTSIIGAILTSAKTHHFPVQSFWLYLTLLWIYVSKFLSIYCMLFNMKFFIPVLFCFFFSFLFRIPSVLIFHRPLRGAVVSTSDSWSAGQGFESASGQHLMWTLHRPFFSTNLI